MSSTASDICKLIIGAIFSSRVCSLLGVSNNWCLKGYTFNQIMFTKGEKMGTRILSSKARQRNHDKYVLLFRSGKMTELDRKNYDLAMTWEGHGLVKPLPIRPWFVKPLQLFVVTLIIGILVWAPTTAYFLIRSRQLCLLPKFCFGGL